MGSEKNPKMDCGSAAAFPTVQELISQLLSSFFATEFQNVTRTLEEREEQMKEKCTELRKKAEEVEREKDLLFLENLKLNDELKKKQQEFDALRKMNLEYKDQIQILNSEKCKASKNLVLEDELKKDCKIVAMRKVNVEHERTIFDLKSEKDRIEAELRAYKKHFSELGDRALSLERTSKTLLGSFGLKVENEQQESQCAAESSKAPLSGENGDLNKRTEPKFQEIIQIDDDDDDLEPISTLKRRRVSNEIKRECNGDYVDNIPTRTQKRKNLQESHNQPIASHSVSTPHSVGIRPCVEKLEPQNLRSSLDSSDSSSDSDNENIDEAYKSIIARWGFEVDMLQEFDEDDELCMSAICALHRRRIQGKLSSSRASIVHAFDISRFPCSIWSLTRAGSNTQLWDPTLDSEMCISKVETVFALFVSRITQLAQLLIDGDPQRKLKKQASELTRSDLDDCRKLAKRYSDQLFNIYQKKDDPFFPPSKLKKKVC